MRKKYFLVSHFLTHTLFFFFCCLCFTQATAQSANTCSSLKDTTSLIVSWANTELIFIQAACVMYAWDLVRQISEAPPIWLNWRPKLYVNGAPNAWQAHVIVRPESLVLVIDVRFKFVNWLPQLFRLMNLITLFGDIKRKKFVCPHFIFPFTKLGQGRVIYMNTSNFFPEVN